MSGYSKYSRRDRSYTYKLTAAVLGVFCALLLVLIGGIVFTQISTAENLEVTVSDEEFQDNLDSYYENMNPVPYSSYVAARNQS